MSADIGERDDWVLVACTTLVVRATFVGRERARGGRVLSRPKASQLWLQVWAMVHRTTTPRQQCGRVGGKRGWGVGHGVERVQKRCGGGTGLGCGTGAAGSVRWRGCSQTHQRRSAFGRVVRVQRDELVGLRLHVLEHALYKKLLVIAMHSLEALCSRKQYPRE